MTLKDFEVSDWGTIVLVTPLTDEARQWVDDNVYTEPWQWMGGGFACEPRMVEALLEGIEVDGEGQDIALDAFEEAHTTPVPLDKSFNP